MSTGCGLVGDAASYLYRRPEASGSRSALSARHSPICLSWGVLPYASGRKMVVFDPRVFALTLGVAVGIGALAGLYPSWRASHVPPMEAVRNE